jgi:hypothetical protein
MEGLLPKTFYLQIEETVVQREAVALRILGARLINAVAKAGSLQRSRGSI